MGETIIDKALVQLALNRLLPSFESTIQDLTHGCPNLTFNRVSSSLIMESHRQEQRAVQLGDQDVLAASYNKSEISLGNQQ